MSCSGCKSGDGKEETMTYVAHEAEMARAERHLKRLWVTIILLIVLLVGTNCAWLYHESQYVDVESATQEVTQRCESGNNSFVGGDFYGSANNPDNCNQEESA